MARGKYLSLEKARKMKRLDRFAKEHPSEGDEQKFDELFERLALPKKGPKTTLKHYLKKTRDTKKPGTQY